MAMILDNIGYFNGLLCRAAFQALLRKFPAELHDTLKDLISRSSTGVNRNIEERTEVWSGLMLGLPNEQSHMVRFMSKSSIFTVLILH